MNERRWVRYGLCNNIVLIRTEVRYDAINKHFTILLEDRRVESAYITVFETENKIIVPIYWFGDNVTLSELFKVDGFCMFDINYSNDNHSDIHFKASSQDFSFENDTARNLAIVKKFDGSDIIRTGVVFPYDG